MSTTITPVCDSNFDVFPSERHSRTRPRGELERRGEPVAPSSSLVSEPSTHTAICVVEGNSSTADESYIASSPGAGVLQISPPAYVRSNYDYRTRWIGQRRERGIDKKRSVAFIVRLKDCYWKYILKYLAGTSGGRGNFCWSQLGLLDI